ncbi:CENP-X/MHF2 family protein [Aspergillus undulatus]|uniref:CENP-X/MHF2 family protein n=1 Tax=Aspergillus undulatus TaxID=1810928 RepID=UPI003CCD2228
MPPERQPTRKRRLLPFKPPSRASKSATASGLSKAPSKTKKISESNTTASSSNAPKPTSRSIKPKPAKPSSSRQRPSLSPVNSNSASPSASRDASPAPSSASGSSSSSDNEASEANYILAEITHTDPAETEDVLSSDPLIPPKLLTKLVHHHFRNEKTKIAKDANAVVAKYIDVFVREAVARAAFERSEGDKGAGDGDGFLEVEDLEKMGPQLAMDF